jgi:hypothetical protein
LAWLADLRSLISWSWFLAARCLVNAAHRRSQLACKQLCGSEPDSFALLICPRSASPFAAGTFEFPVLCLSLLSLLTAPSECPSPLLVAAAVVSSKQSGLRKGGIRNKSMWPTTSRGFLVAVVASRHGAVLRFFCKQRCEGPCRAVGGQRQARRPPPALVRSPGGERRIRSPCKPSELVDPSLSDPRWAGHIRGQRR